MEELFIQLPLALIMEDLHLIMYKEDIIIFLHIIIHILILLREIITMYCLMRICMQDTKASILSLRLKVLMGNGSNTSTKAHLPNGLNHLA